MNEFSPGDTVKRRIPSSHSYMIMGKLYTVEKCIGRDLYLVGIPLCWSKNYFELAEVPDFIVEFSI